MVVLLGLILANEKPATPSSRLQTATKSESFLVDATLEDGAVSVRHIKISSFNTICRAGWKRCCDGLRPRLGLRLCCWFGAAGGLPLPVMAQGGTVLAVDPAQASVEVNGQREIHLLVTGAENLNAFDVQVEYDSALLSLTKWEFGDLLSNLAVVKRDDLPGSFRLVATQLATPGVSGDGVLLKLTFSGKLTGSSPITITKAEFARSEGGLSLPELEHGTMTIIPAQPTATPTRTPTATATLAPTHT